MLSDWCGQNIHWLSPASFVVVCRQPLVDMQWHQLHADASDGRTAQYCCLRTESIESIDFQKSYQVESARSWSLQKMAVVSDSVCVCIESHRVALCTSVNIGTLAQIATECLKAVNQSAPIFVVSSSL